MATPKPRHPLIVVLIRARNDAGLTQAEVAQRLGIVPSAIGNWEAGTRAPRLGDTARWAEALGLRLVLARTPRRNP